MGYRAHTITQEREYGSAVFSNWNDFEVFTNKTQDELDWSVSDDQSYYELEKAQLKRYAEQLTFKVLQGEDPDEPSDHPNMMHLS